MHISHWNVVAIHGQGLLFFIAEGILLVILLHESCTDTYFFLLQYFYWVVTVL